MIRMRPLKMESRPISNPNNFTWLKKLTAFLLAIVNLAPHRSKSASAFTAANGIARASEKTVKAS